VALLGLGSPIATGSAQAPSDVGYIGPSHGGLSAPTGEKPESKLWYAGGFWWADLFNPEVGRHQIYRFDRETYQWIDTGTPLDTRASSRSDVLWDPGTGRLYVVSHVFTTSAAPTAADTNWGYLFRYHYDPGILRFLPDEGFPVAVTRGKAEALTLAKDSVGTLWVAYVENRQVMVNHSESNDATWGVPRPLPTPNSGALSSDDIAAVVSFGADRIGIAWSAQRQSTMYFAVHQDGTPADQWTQEIIISEPEIADDHINLKADSAGRVYLASKTSDTHESPLVVLYVRSAQGVWRMYPFGTGFDGHTRPIVLIDEAQGQLHMFAAAPETGGRIYYKRAPLNAIAFSSGPGELVLQNAVDGRLNNVTSTKQSVDASSGLLILASGSTNRYFFNFFPLTPARAPALAPPLSTPVQSAPAGDAPGLAPGLP